MWAWLCATRIPAIGRLKILLDPTKPDAQFQAQIPAQARWRTDNYNHLMEQPTLFYAVALTLPSWAPAAGSMRIWPGSMWACG
jgi:hypothetical protein